MEEGGGEEEINYDENDYNNYDDYNNEVDIDIENENNIINNTKDNIANLEDYEIIEYSQIVKIRKEIILKFMENTCLKYEEAELILIHYNWNYDKLIDIWFDETEKIKIESHIEQHPDTKKLLSNNNNDNKCPICKSEIEKENVISLKCNHKICKNCLISYIYDILFSDPDKIISTLCPYPNCNLYLTNDIFKQCIIDKELLNIYKNCLEKNFIQTCKNIKHCPNKKCNYYIKCLTNIPKEIKCKCGFVFCFSCLNESHNPINCDMARTWNAIDLEYQKKYKLDEIGYTKQKCPSC